MVLWDVDKNVTMVFYYYHKNFGVKARKFVDPCKYVDSNEITKNEQIDLSQQYKVRIIPTKTNSNQT